MQYQCWTVTCCRVIPAWKACTRLWYIDSELWMISSMPFSDDFIMSQNKMVTLVCVCIKQIECRVLHQGNPFFDDSDLPFWSATTFPGYRNINLYLNSWYYICWYICTWPFVQELHQVTTAFLCDIFSPFSIKGVVNMTTMHTSIYWCCKWVHLAGTCE